MVYVYGRVLRAAPALLVTTRRRASFSVAIEKCSTNKKAETILLAPAFIRKVRKDNAALVL